MEDYAVCGKVQIKTYLKGLLIFDILSFIIYVVSFSYSCHILYLVQYDSSFISTTLVNNSFNFTTTSINLDFFSKIVLSFYIVQVFLMLLCCLIVFPLRIFSYAYFVIRNGSFQSRGILFFTRIVSQVAYSLILVAILVSSIVMLI